MISLLTPTRGRPESLQRMVYSALRTADRAVDEVEIIAYRDEDDTSYGGIWPSQVRLFVSRGRRNLSELFDLCHKEAAGSIFMSCDDDVVFRTKGWDTKVKEAFAKVPDKIALVYGNDGSGEDKTHAPHPFIHQNWVDAVGRYLPPYFRGDFCDTWLNDLADGIGRKVRIDATFEHLHPAFNKGVTDNTRQEKIDHHFKNNMPDVYYKETVKEREGDTKKLQRYIDEQA